MPHLTPEAHRWLEQHHGIASIDALISCGVALHDIRRIRRAGGLELVLQGAYRSPSVPLDEHARCAAVCIAHPDAAIAGPTAGRLWGFRRLPKDLRVHVLAPPGSHPTGARWVVPYRTAAIHESDIIQRPDGIRLTSRPRTALDLARVLGPLDLRSVIEQAMADGHHSAEEMIAVALDWLSPRRPWARRYVEHVLNRVDGGGAESHQELLVAEGLAAAGVRGLVRQHLIDLPGYGRARFDLAVPCLRWAIEVDGHPSHAEPAGIRADAMRDAAAARLGWTVSRLTPSDLRTLASTISSLVALHRSLLGSGCAFAG